MASCSAWLITLALILSRNGRGPVALVPIVGPSVVEPIFRAVDPAVHRLCLEPSHRTLQVSFARDMKSLRAISPRTAAPTHRHLPIGLRKMVIAEPSAYSQRFRTYHALPTSSPAQRLPSIRVRANRGYATRDAVYPHCCRATLVGGSLLSYPLGGRTTRFFR